MKKIGLVQTKDQIADVLREYVISGRLVPEQEIVQEELADKLQLSRTPVREALQLLEKEGYLERLSNRHMRVRAISHDEIAKAFKIIAGIEYELMDIILVRDIDISGLNESFGKYLNSCDTELMHQARVYELELHRAVSEITGYGYLANLHQRLLAGYPGYVIMKSDKGPAGRVKSVKRILESLSLKRRPELKAAVEEYYSDLAECYAK
ncbi:GntR family transcriptional regulator [Youngiibacter multivorans]|uniref:DNA-binding GntR family transcriptional regulator n=1 Tax=Youngiibacter multivorans TaxID=937251 RepID=A0ABS4FZI7_9CLOT|nr:GntR family transcriptional regulator [Youngiibacter multivorans]MBP1917631.1 DNA-binding GntR family transcriptional regulator [Youngiibacter multivorans]